nr:glutamate--cysteine ligase [Actinomycetota bacterium]
MGQQESTDAFSREDRQRYRRKVQRCLDALERMLAEGGFAQSPPTMGLEIELNLVDEALQPAMINSSVLEKIDDPWYTTELGQHNLELNVPPRLLRGEQSAELEVELRR